MPASISATRGSFPAILFSLPKGGDWCLAARVLCRSRRVVSSLWRFARLGPHIYRRQCRQKGHHYLLLGQAFSWPPGRSLLYCCPVHRIAAGARVERAGHDWQARALRGSSSSPILKPRMAFLYANLYMFMLDIRWLPLTSLRLRFVSTFLRP